MAIMYIPRQQSPWEQMLPQILGQMALMKIQQGYRAKEQEMELAGKIGLAGGKKLTAEEIKAPIQEGYRRFQYGGKTYRVPMSIEERLAEQKTYKLGTDWYKDIGGGELERITPKEYQPQLFINPTTGEQKWIEPGKSVPVGFEKWTTPKRPTSELSVIAQSLGLDLTQPLTPKDAKNLVEKVTTIKKERAKATLLELLLGLSGRDIPIQPSTQPIIDGLTIEEQTELEKLRQKNRLVEGYNIIKQPIQ